MIKLKELVRTHLEEELQQLWDKPLMLITSPSGYGKTTLLKSYLSKQENIVIVWIALGQEMVDEEWVWKRLCIKCQEVDEDLAQKLTAMGLPKSAQEVGYIRDYIKEAIDRPVCLVIDDFQECSNEYLNQLIIRLTYDSIPDFHMILISRIYPNLPYEEMFLKGCCVTIDQMELGLTRAETAEIFRLNDVELDEEGLDGIYEYTDGWISAVYLTLYDYRRNQKLGTYRSASHLLKTAIFDKLSPRLQELYMKMSLFDNFTLEEAVYVAQIEIHPEILMEAIETYGFMQYNPDHKRYRMHSLLRTVARGELERAEIDKKTLYNRDGDWCVRNGNYLQAVADYKNAGNFRAILGILSGDMRYKVIESMPVIMKEIYMDVSTELRAEYPVAYLSYIYSTIGSGDISWGICLYEEACRLFASDNMDENRKKLHGELLLVGTLLKFNDLKQMNAMMKEAYELLGKRPSSIFSQTLLTYGVPFMTLLYYNKAGSLKETIELEKEYAHYHLFLVGIGDGQWDDLFDAEYAVLTGDFEKALRLAGQIQKRAVFQKQPCIVISSYYIELKCMMCMGMWQQVGAKMEQLKEFRKTLDRKTLVVDADLVYSYTYACLGQKEKMDEWMADFNLERCSRVVRNARSGCMAYGMLLCRIGDWQMLDSIAEQILVPYETTCHVYALIKGYIYKTIAAYHLEGTEKAQEYFWNAVSLAEQDDVRIPFIENSPELAPVIDGLEKRNRFLISLKTQMQQYRKFIKQFLADEGKPALTEREKELLSLVEAGYRNADISRELNIAKVTVEKTLTAVYRKLGVTNRAGAVAKWNQIEK